MNVLVTGANGFIGRSLSSALSERGYSIRGTVRDPSMVSLPGNAVPDFEAVNVSDIGPGTDWMNVLGGMNTVVHLAARVHIMRETASNPLEEYRIVNTAGTRELARAAADRGVRRFIYLSSIKVNGEQSAEHPFTEEDNPCPGDPYAVSKWEAEQTLLEVAQLTGLEVVILRPPLVYGPGVKANFLKLIELVSRGVVLPLAQVSNHRSFIYLGNLVDAIITCVAHPAAPGETFLVSDGCDVATPELIRIIAAAMNKRVRLVSFPLPFLRILGKIAGKGAEVERLTGSLRVDSSKIRNALAWRPPFTMNEGIYETVKWYESL